MKYFLVLPVVVAALAGSVLFAGPSFAQGSNLGQTSESKFIPQCLLGSKVDTKCDNVNVFIWLAINVGTYLFGFIGALALLFFVYGGFILILSQGNQEKVKQGTGAMTAAVIGLIISFSAYALITFLSKTVGVKTEKSLNFIETVYAQGSQPSESNGCMINGSCVPRNDVNEFCASPCTFDLNQTLTEEELQKLYSEQVGEKPEGAEGVSALKQGAAKLNPMNIGEPADLLARGINALLAFMGSIALVLYIYAGFIWMSASGSAEKVTKAKAILIWTTLGIAAMGASYMVVRTILERIG